MVEQMDLGYFREMADNENVTPGTGVKFPFGLPGKSPPATIPKTGINFQHGFPGRENSSGSRAPGNGPSKQNVATNTNNRGNRGGSNYSVSRGTQVARGNGGGGNRGFGGRGNGNVRGNRGGRGGNRGHYHSPNNNNNNNEFKAGKGQAEETVIPCEVCDRPKTHIQCFTCGWKANNLRVKKVCSTHPKVDFLSDLSMCPQCNTGNILECKEEEEA